ncbi:hypothetical protein BDR05DRAFT_1062709 [Suillus weaverae]|nr:hypothetical protein BDR05DRAFT_1062709 [Suillus weaverae]
MSIPSFDSAAYSTYSIMDAKLQGHSEKSNTAETDKTDIHKLLTSGIVPRPIAFVSTISWFNTVTNYPPMISFACNHSALGRLKGTTLNVKNSQGFIVNIISEPFVENARENAYACTFMIRYMRQQPGVQVQIKASRVKESAFSMECEILPIQSQVSTTACSCISPPLFITIIFPLSRHPPTVTNVLGGFHESSTHNDTEDDLIRDEDYAPRPSNSQPLATGQLMAGEHGSGRLCYCL